jgi:hypothetical protein
MTTEQVLSLPAVDPDPDTLSSFWRRIAYLTTRTRYPGRGWVGSPEVMLWNMRNSQVCIPRQLADEINIVSHATGAVVDVIVCLASSTTIKLHAANVAIQKSDATGKYAFYSRLRETSIFPARSSFCMRIKTAISIAAGH